MDKVYSCPFCGGSVVTKSDFIEDLFLCENQGCRHIFRLQDASETEKKVLGKHRGKEQKIWRHIG